MKKQVRKAKRKLERSLVKKGKKNRKQFYSYLKSKTSNRVSVWRRAAARALQSSLVQGQVHLLEAVQGVRPSSARICSG